ncbi:O-methyltransferase [Corynebacterium glyciniphilum]|uniref:O-methyltransferase n=1 Tax=Corynebacterium glyciniphilum TaxID=1404244 RepID=UPI003FCFC3D6
MTPELLGFLERLYADGRDVDARRPDRLDRRRNLEPESAALLRSLVAGANPATVLELGTSNDYSTIWLADVVALTTVDNDPRRSADAAENLDAAGVSDRVRRIVADGAEILAGSGDGEWEFIFLDAERSLYVDWWTELQRTLAVNGLLVVDNVLSHADQVAEFRALVDAAEGFRSLVLPVGAGLLVIARQD